MRIRTTHEGSKSWAYPFSETIQDLNLHKSLMMEPLLVANDFDCHRFASAMIPAVQYLTERPFAKSVDDFITIRKMISHYDQVVSTFIIISMIIRGVLQRRWLLVALGANVIDRGEFQYFLTLVL